MSSSTSRSAAATCSLRPLEGHVIAADEHGHVGVLVLDRRQQPVLRAEQPHHRHAIDLELGVPVRRHASRGVSLEAKGALPSGAPLQHVRVHVEHGLADAARRC